jgi:D-alanyl-D-alanine endopeptidase (penicillin-binding protein 7)
VPYKFFEVKTRGPVRRLAIVAAALVAGALPMAGLLAPAAATAATGGAAKRHRPKRRAARRHVFLERHVAATKGGQPNVQALGALVLDDTGHEVFARNPDRERPIASISKLAATLTVVDHGLELEGLSTITKADIEVAKGGARSRLLEGTTLSNRDLLHAALMGSDNRAIPALGRAVKLSPSQLTAAMNAKARSLGLHGTRFHDPTGLSSENVSTPRETITMLRAVMSHPVLGPITRRSEYDAHPVGRPPIHYINTDHPAARSNVQVLAGKTGYNDDARYCLVIATKVDGRPYFMSFLSNEGKLTRFGDVARVADWLVSRRPRGAAGAAGGPAALPVGVAAPPPEEPEPEPEAAAPEAPAGAVATP